MVHNDTTTRRECHQRVVAVAVDNRLGTTTCANGSGAWTNARGQVGGCGCSTTVSEGEGSVAATCVAQFLGARSKPARWLVEGATKPHLSAADATVRGWNNGGHYVTSYECLGQQGDVLGRPLVGFTDLLQQLHGGGVLPNYSQRVADGIDAFGNRESVNVDPGTRNRTTMIKEKRKRNGTGRARARVCVWCVCGVCVCGVALHCIVLCVTLCATLCCIVLCVLVLGVVLHCIVQRVVLCCIVMCAVLLLFQDDDGDDDEGAHDDDMMIG